jgi:flagellar biosynthesis regulator FlbT
MKGALDFTLKTYFIANNVIMQPPQGKSPYRQIDSLYSEILESFYIHG